MFRILLSVLLFISTPVFAVTQWNKAIPASGDTKSSWPGQVTAQWSILDTLVSNYRRGERVIYKNSTTLTVTLGEIVVSNSGGSLRVFLQDSGNTDITTANLDSGASFSSSTTYYVYAATSSSTASSSTYYISLSSSAPTGPTYYAQIGNFITDGSGSVISQKVYTSAYGTINATSAGIPQVQASYDYGTSSSASTLVNGVLMAYGNVSVGAKSSAAITNLPYTSSTSYKCTCNHVAGTLASMNGPCAVSYSSGSQVNISNAADSTFTESWVCTGT